MTETFILQNQRNLFWGKSKEWVDGHDASAVFKTLHKDEAINQLVEVSAKDFTQRISIVQCGSDEKGLPVIDPAILPDPLPKQPKPPKMDEDLFSVESHSPASAEDEVVSENF